MQLHVTWEGGSATFEPTQAVSVGRVAENTVVVDAPMVSRQHLMLRFADGAWTFHDGSSNGTFVNGERLDIIGTIHESMTLQLGAIDGPAVRVELVAQPERDDLPEPPSDLHLHNTVIGSAIGGVVDDGSQELAEPAPPPPPPVEVSESMPEPPAPSSSESVELDDGAAAAPIAPAVLPAPPAPIASVPPAPVVPAPAAPMPEPPAAPDPVQQSTPVEPSGPGTVQLTERSLMLEYDQTTRSFAPGQHVVVGRDASCDMQVSSQLVSARHCEFVHDGEQWWIHDLDSTRGTWIDHKKVTKRKIEGAFFVLLGDDDAGAPLRVVTGGVHRKPKDRRPLLFAGIATAALVVAGLATWFALSGDDSSDQIAALQAQIEEQQRQTDEQLADAEARAQQAIDDANAAGGAGNSPSELMAARLSTALISVPDEFGDIVGTGSGALVSDDGLILTNIHVVLHGLEYERTGAPEFEGGTDAEELLVAFPSVDGGPADLFFIAEQFAAHPAHDAALIRVVEGLDGATLDDLPDPLPIGSSADLRAGDEIAVVGYPGTAFTERVSVALSNFQSFQPCFEGNPVDTGWGCLRDYDEGYLNLAGETLEGGSSGGPVIRGGEVVGIQLGIFEVGTSAGQNLGVPIDLIAADLPIG